MGRDVKTVVRNRPSREVWARWPALDLLTDENEEIQWPVGVTDQVALGRRV